VGAGELLSAGDTITDTEAIAAGDRLGMHPEVVIRLMHEIRSRRYEPGEMYQDEAGVNWEYATPEPDSQCCWMRPGSAGVFSRGYPEGRVRRLVPEGSQAAKVHADAILEAIRESARACETSEGLARRITRLVGGAS
jgi:hypothetical protein